MPLKKEALPKMLWHPCGECSGNQQATAMSIQSEAQSITKKWLMAVRPFADVMRCQIVPSWMDISIAACPSMRP
jgi:hypothetical protein